MKKRKILLTSLLAISAFSALSAGIIIKNNLNNENKDKEDINDNLKENTFVESPEACDDEFGGGSDILLSPQTVTYNSLNSDVVDALYSPKLGYQYSYNSTNHTVSIRFTAAITSLNVKAVWTRTAYDSDGNVVKATKNVEVTNAYRGITENDSTITYATDIEVGEEHPYNYFVCYTIRNIPTDNDGNALYKIDASLTISQDENKTSTDTGSVNASETPSENESYTYQLDFDDTYTYKSNKNTSAGNGQYIAGKVKTIYSTSDTELNTDYLTVNVNKTTSSATTTMPIYYDDFSSYEVTFTGFEAGVAGEQSINVNYGNATKAYKIYVVNTEAYVDSEGNYVVTVDQNYDGVIGAVDENNLSKGNMFKTIGQALEFLQNSSFVNQNSNKILNIGAGYYYEKLEINTPNLTINGAGSTTGTYYKDANNKDVNYDSATYSTATIIEYDTLYGDYCDGIVSDDETKNHKHTTESTQTVAVRESATNCKINNITISNANNCKEYFIANYGSNNVEHRALAILIQADQFVMNNSSLLGYQDTIQLFTGRQYLYNTYISGATDYIFGTNNITLFDQCKIHTISTGSSNGGYITAFKGTNNDINQGVDSPDYGVVFKSCTIEADSGVSNVALGRPWKLYANVAYIGCNMDSSVSKTAYDTENNPTQGARYVAWNSTSGPYPTSSTVKFVEYGNTGAGAISATQVGMTMLTEDVAKNYYDYSVIFGKTNGKVTFDLAWDPINGVEKDNNIYYDFHGDVPTTGTVYTFSEEQSNVSGNYTIGDLTFTNVQRRTNENDDLWVGTSISFSVKAGTTVTIESYPGYHNYRIGDIYADADKATYYFATSQNVTITSLGNLYLYGITINEKLDEETPVLTSITASGYPSSEYEIGDDYDISNLKIKAHYSNGTYVVVDDYTTDADSVINKTTAGTYEVTVTYNDGTTVKTTSFNVKYVSTVSDSFDENTVIDFSNSDALEASLLNSKITYANGFTCNDHKDSIQLQSLTSYFSFKVKAGATVTVTSYGGEYGYLLIDGVSNNSASTYSKTYTTDSTVTISAENSENTGNSYSKSYLKKITITYPAVISSNTTINFGNNCNIDSIEGVTYTASIGPNGNNSQVKEGTITLSVLAGATVKVYGYGGSAGTNQGDYTYYTVTANNSTSEEQHGDYEVTVTTDSDVIITPTNGNNYLMSIVISYQTE